MYLSGSLLPLVDCSDRHLDDIPNFDPLITRSTVTIYLRNNFIQHPQINKTLWISLKTMYLENNPVYCEYIQSLEVQNITVVYSNCTADKFKNVTTTKSKIPFWIMFSQVTSQLTSTRKPIHKSTRGKMFKTSKLYSRLRSHVPTGFSTNYKIASTTVSVKISKSTNKEAWKSSSSKAGTIKNKPTTNLYSTTQLGHTKDD